MSELFAEIDRVISRLDSDDPDFDDCVDAVALLERMRAEMAGPDGFPTWKDAAVHERQARATAESRLAAAEAAINAALDALNDAPEINPSNYDHDQVCALNREACYAFGVLNDHVAARGVSDDDS